MGGLRKIQGTFWKKLHKKEGSQGSLEYIIIIGGVIIIAAATYFMLKGFSQTTGAGTTETIGVAGDKFRLELENLGRTETRFLVRKWGSFPQLSRLTLNNTGSPATADITIYNLTDYGIDLDELQFAYNDSGSIESAEQTVEGSTIGFTTPLLPSGTSAILVFHNNSSALKLDNLNYTSSDPDVNVTNGTSPEESPDTTPPTIVISATAYGSSGSVKDADIQATVTDANSSITEVYYSIDNSPYFKADNLYYGYQDITVESHPEDYSYNSNSETIHILATVPSEDNYTVKVRAVDEYSNEKVETQNVSIAIGPPSADTTPPAILSTQPANNSEVYDSPITINVTTNETAHCRFSNESGTSYDSMTDFNNTDSITHNITNVTLQDWANYTYYFRCNDTSGNVNETDYVLNFTVADLTPPAILSTQPANNSEVYTSPITINISTNEIAHCRFSNESGTPYPSMTDFNNTDSTQHNITNASISEGETLTYYFKCNDTSGNVNETDHVLSFTRPFPCFLAGTEIIIQGGTKAIESIVPGDMVLTFDLQTWTPEYSRVTKTLIHDTYGYLIINGVLKVTPHHYMYSDGKWVRARNLGIGDTLETVNGTMTIVSIMAVYEPVKAYNFEVDDNHNYFAQGILAHNAKG